VKDQLQRGGSWNDFGASAWGAKRNDIDPASCNEYYGFRPVVVAEDTPRLLRGGSLFHAVAHTRCAHRFSIAPGSRFETCGFRPVVVP
jgi:formylglycine-generating enzyme required for sulfatase activity